MLMHFFLLRDGVTSTSTTLDMLQIDSFHRWITSSLRGSATDSSKYHYIAMGHTQDINENDFLEEITRTVTGSLYDVVNVRIVSGSHMEFDLEKLHG